MGGEGTRVRRGGSAKSPIHFLFALQRLLQKILHVIQSNCIPYPIEIAHVYRHDIASMLEEPRMLPFNNYYSQILQNLVLCLHILVHCETAELVFSGLVRGGNDALELGLVHTIMRILPPIFTAPHVCILCIYMCSCICIAMLQQGRLVR